MLKPKTGIILFALWLILFSASSQTMIMSPILPQIGRELHVPQDILGTLATSYSVMLGLFALITGPISDSIGRRKVLIFGTGAMAFTLLLHHWADDYLSLLLMRALSGMAGGMLSGVAPAYIGDYFVPEKRGWANGVVVTGIAAGQILGIPSGTVLAAQFSVTMPFVFFAFPMMVAFILVCKGVPQPPVKRADSLTIQRTAHRYLTMLRDPSILAATASYAMMFMGIAFYLIYLPTWLEETFHTTGNDIASLFVVGGLASVAISPMAGRLSDRIGRKNLIIWSCVGLSVLMAATTVLMVAFWVAYPLFFLVMVMVGARMGPFQALLSEIVPDEQRGSLMSLGIAIGQVAMGIGSALSGFVYTEMGYGTSSVIGGAGMLAMAFLVWMYIKETRPRTA